VSPFTVALRTEFRNAQLWHFPLDSREELLRRILCSLSLFCGTTPSCYASKSAVSVPLMRLFGRRTALRLWCSLARWLALLHLLLLSSMLLFELLRLLSVALLHLLLLCVVVVLLGALLVFFLLMAKQSNQNHDWNRYAEHQQNN
jgi:hypothetical protein